nr:uncharacterized protein LOC112546614 [Pelodiscus sinensis]|eukprot:XP_025043062.1 uncharacterized protein LOC112546614 [Pelodiscus sinensis]
MSALVLMQTGLHTPVQQGWQEVPREDVEEKEEEQQTEDILILTLQPIPETQEASQASSNAGEGASAGPAAADHRATPVPPPTQSHSTRKHWRAYNDLLWRRWRKLRGPWPKCRRPCPKDPRRRLAGIIACLTISYRSGAQCVPPSGRPWLCQVLSPWGLLLPIQLQPPLNPPSCPCHSSSPAPLSLPPPPLEQSHLHSQLKPEDGRVHGQEVAKP